MWDEAEVPLNVTKRAGTVCGIEVVDRTHAIPSLAAEDGTHELDPKGQFRVREKWSFSRICIIFEYLMLNWKKQHVYK